MELTEGDLGRIPARNLRVPRAEFVAVWVAAEGGTGWYVAGVATTCRWVARATVRPEAGPWHPARSPVLRRANLAFEELIEEEYLAAEVLDLRRPRPQWLVTRPGWIEGVCATLRWSWRRLGPAPLQVDQSATG